jgi:hypothetical protein
MTERDAIVFQAAHLFAQTELEPGLALPGLHTVEQTEGVLADQVGGFKDHMVGLLKDAGLSFTNLQVPEKIFIVMAEADIVTPYDLSSGVSEAGVLTDEELGSEGESADDFTYTDVPRNVDALFTVKISDIQRSRTTLEPLFAGREDADYALPLTEKAIALEVWMGLGGVAFTGLDPRINSDDVPSDVFTKLAAQMSLPHEGLEFDGTYNASIRNMLIAARQRFAGALAYQGIQYSERGYGQPGLLLDADVNLLKAVHRSLFRTQVQTGQYQGDLRQFALAHPLDPSELTESIRILTS